MTTQEHLLTLVMEECAETAQRASKAIRFGIDEVQPGQPHDNIMRMMIEYTDLVAVFEVMMEEGMLTSALQEDLEWHHEAKKVKIREQMELSRKMGTLEPKKSLWHAAIEEADKKRKNDLLKAHGFMDEDHSKLSDTTWTCYNSGCKLKCNDCPDKGLTAEEVAAKHHHNGLTERPCTISFMPKAVKIEAKVGVEVKESPEFKNQASRGQWNPFNTVYQELVDCLGYFVRKGKVNPDYTTEILTLASTMQVRHEKEVQELRDEIRLLKASIEHVDNWRK